MSKIFLRALKLQILLTILKKKKQMDTSKKLIHEIKNNKIFSFWLRKNYSYCFYGTNVS